MSRHPSTKWAQRKDKVFITIELPDAENVKLNLQPDGHFNFSATAGAGGQPYELELELYDKVNVDESKAAVGLRNICYIVKKVENEWWPRLLKQGGKPPVYLKVDWDKWVDEDEGSKFGDDMDFGDMDFSKLGMGGADEGFDDDDIGGKEGDDDDMEEVDPEEDASKNDETAAAAPSEPEAKA